MREVVIVRDKEERTIVSGHYDKVIFPSDCMKNQSMLHSIWCEVQLVRRNVVHKHRDGEVDMFVWYNNALQYEIQQTSRKSG